MNFSFFPYQFLYLIANRCFWGALLLLFCYSCQSSSADTRKKLPPLAPPENSSELRVLTYNLYMRAPQLFFWNKQRKRTKLLPDYLTGYDVLILQEVFMNKNRNKLLSQLQEHYPYRTRILGKDKFIQQDGGVIMASRWPIEKEAQQLYDDCAGSDCMATKGALYAKINKGGIPYHLFGTHTQANPQHRQTREQQFRQLSAFIDQQAIDAAEPVIIAGDLNVDRYTGLETGEFPSMLEVLAATHPQPQPGPDYAATLDGNENDFVNTPVKEHLDYALYSDRHLQPDSSFNQVKIFRHEGLDLSDHYAVYGFFSF